MDMANVVDWSRGDPSQASPDRLALTRWLLTADDARLQRSREALLRLAGLGCHSAGRIVERYAATAVEPDDPGGALFRRPGHAAHPGAARRFDRVAYGAQRGRDRPRPRQRSRGLTASGLFAREAPEKRGKGDPRAGQR